MDPQLLEVARARQGLHARRRRARAARRRARRRARRARCSRSAPTAGSRRCTSARRHAPRARCCSPSTTTAARRRTRPGGSTTIPRSSTRGPAAWTRCRSSGARSTAAEPRGRRRRRRRPLGDRSPRAWATPLGVPVHRRRPRRRRRDGRLRRLVAARRARRSARDPRRVRRPRRGRPSAVPRVAARGRRRLRARVDHRLVASPPPPVARSVRESVGTISHQSEGRLHSDPRSRRR